MRVMLLWVVTIFALSSCADGSDLGKDGFNFYKDYLRGRPDEVISPVADRTLYFYRTPLQLHPELLPVILDQEYRKRTGNAFKNHMLSKDLAEDYRNPDTKRSSKIALSQMRGQGKHETYQNLVPVPTELIEVSLE